MFFDQEIGLWVDSTFQAMAPKVGETRLINCGGPWSCVRVVIVSVEETGEGRCKVYAKELK